MQGLSVLSVLELVAYHRPEANLLSTCSSLSLYSLSRGIRSVLYGERLYKGSEPLPRIDSWLVPECKDREIDVVLINHTARELVRTTTTNLLSCLVGLTHLTREERLENRRSGLSNETRFSLSDSYEVRPLCQGVSDRASEYGLIHV